MKKLLALLFAIALVLCSMSAMAQTTADVSYTPDTGNVSLNPYNNRIAMRKTGSNNYYVMLDADGNELTDAYYLCMDTLCEYFEVATESGVNNRGLIDADGAEVIPMQYGDIEYLDSRWQLGIVLEQATEDNYDYKSSSWSDETTFYLVSAYDVYYCGNKIGSLARNDYDWGNAYGAYLYIKDVKGNWSFYDSSFNKSDYVSDDGSSEFEFSSNWHKGSNQRAFVAGCTLTSDDVKQDIICINNQCYDLQGNLLFVGAHPYDYVHYFEGDYAKVKYNGKYGLINRNGEEVIPCLYDEITASDSYMGCGYQGVVKDGKFGYVDAQGNETAEFKYSSSAVNAGYYPFAYIDGLDGKIIVISGAIGELPNTYDEIQHSWNENCPLLAVEDNGQAGVIDLWGNAVIPMADEYDTYDFSISNDGTIIVADGDNSGIVVYKVSYDDTASVAETAEESELLPEPTPTTPAVETEAEAQADDGTWTCTECGTQNSGNFCTNCGAGRPEAQVTCAQCGYQPEGDVPNFCPNCGTQF